MEIWKDIKDYEGLYQISNLGNVKSLKTNSILKPSRARKYIGVNLYKNKVVKTRTIHRLVAEHFLSNPENKPCVNHLDEDVTNNNVENLQWCTYKENNNYGNHNVRKYVTSIKNYLVRNYPQEIELINKLQEFRERL